MERNDEWVAEAMIGLRSSRGAARLDSSKALRMLSEREPELLYPHFDSFAALLDQENLVLRWNALLTLANLARVDEQAKIERILDRYLSDVWGSSMITAANAIRGAVIIATAIPALIPRVLPAIMRVEEAVYTTAEYRNVAIGHALDGLAALAPLVDDARPLRLFAARQLGNRRLATSARARRFLKTRIVAAA
ncbi:MAG: hypothetical protein ABI759_18405 [Candidatus Solibacter sp.]